MSDKTRKLKDKASRCVSKGKYKDAVLLYEKCLRLDSADLAVRQKLAETYTRVGQKEQALKEYQAVAGSYAADGLLLKAIAISKVILTLDPEHTETQSALAELYAQRQSDRFGHAQKVSMPKAMSRGVSVRSAKATSTPRAATGTKNDEMAEVEVVDDDIMSLDVPIVTVVTTDLQDLIEMVGADVSDASDTPDNEVIELLALDDDDAFEAVPGTSQEEIDAVQPVEVTTNALPPIPLFSELSPDAFVALTEKMTFESVAAGEVIVAEGDDASNMYIIVQGHVRVERTLDGREKRVLANLSDGAFFGEMALLSSAPRTASVVAEVDTMLFAVSETLLAEMKREHPQLHSVMERFHRNRMLTNLLKTSPIFAPFPPKEKRSLIEMFKSREVAPKQTLITKDFPGRGLYVLLSGRCSVFSENADGEEIVLAELREGDVFGEMSLLFREKSVASVRTTTPCTVLRLAREHAAELVSTHPQVLEALSQLSSARAMENRIRLGPHS